MESKCKLDILPPAQAELEEIARIHLSLIHISEPTRPY